MRASRIDLDRVTAAIEEAARDEILPHFRRLAAEAVFSKESRWDPQDVVTAVDRAVELRLEAALRSILPEAPLVGEEAADADPALLDLLQQPGPVWVLDPLDGTRNYVAGNPCFGVMAALVVDGVTRASWIHLPVYGRTYVAEAGSGARQNGVPLRALVAPPDGPLRGTILTRFMPPGMRESVERRATRCEILPIAGGACWDYPAVAAGEKGFVLYYRLLPWDHAPGALILTEAGGVVRHPDGTPYRPTDLAAPTLMAADEASWRRANEVFFSDPG